MNQRLRYVLTWLLFAGPGPVMHIFNLSTSKTFTKMSPLGGPFGKSTFIIKSNANEHRQSTYINMYINDIFNTLTHSQEYCGLGVYPLKKIN